MEFYLQLLLSFGMLAFIVFISYRLYKKRNGDFVSENPAHPISDEKGGGGSNEEEEVKIIVDYKQDRPSLINKDKNRNKK